MTGGRYKKIVGSAALAYFAAVWKSCASAERVPEGCVSAPQKFVNPNIVFN